MAGIQGRRFTEAQISRIKSLLATTDMTVSEIALRMGCSREPIRCINQRFDIRRYNGKKNDWLLTPNYQIQTE